MEFAPGIVVAERFRLIRPLGQGGMGSVWLAQHIALDVPCALKFISEEAGRSHELRARFEREAKAAAQLRSPHVVQILDHGVWQDQPFIAMEYLEGEDLGQRLARVGTLSPAETVSVTLQVARALTKAHAAGLVHRDLKPANVFLVRDDEGELVKVLDFGVAKVQGVGLDGSTKTGAILGTPYYMSPEQARGSKNLDHRSDLWALAVVAYECLTGRPPFMADALGELMVQIIMEPLPVPSAVAAVPSGFDAWWMRAAARDPAQRFQTAKELAEALSASVGVTGRSGEVDPTTGMAISFSGLRVPGPLPGTTLEPGITSPGTPLPYGMPPAGPVGSTTGASWSGVGPTTLQQSVSVATSPRHGGVLVAMAAGVVIVGAGVFGLYRFGIHRTSSAQSAAAEASAVAETAGPPATSAPTAPAPAPAASAADPLASSPAVSPSALGEAPSAASVPTLPVRRLAPTPSKPAASAKASPNCDPNFYLDAEGQKHFKPECFK